MSRWFLVLIALLLPLQLTWASVAEYCGDAHQPAAEHALHLHAEDAGEATCDAVEPDCGQCHGHFAAMPLTVALQRTIPAPFATAQLPARRLVPLPAPRPERPQWPPLA